MSKPTNYSDADKFVNECQRVSRLMSNNGRVSVTFVPAGGSGERVVLSYIPPESATSALAAQMQELMQQNQELAEQVRQMREEARVKQVKNKHTG